jgi:peptidylprolyl isomerase
MAEAWIRRIARTASLLASAPVRRYYLVPSLFAVALFAGACASKQPTAVGGATGIDGVTVTGDAGSKPTIAISDQAPPATLASLDLIVGNGAEAASGQTVTVQYIGLAWSTKQQFDASWDRGQPFSFPLGVGQVIPGWDQGVAGMKVGGRRLLIIPSELGYGASGFPPAIAANETLVFVIDLVSIG